MSIQKNQLKNYFFFCVFPKVIRKKKGMNDPKMMMIDLNMMTIDPNMRLLTLEWWWLTRIWWWFTLKWWRSTRKWCFYRKLILKITGPTGILGENRDYKTIIREPFANDLTHMFDEWTVPLRSSVAIEIFHILKWVSIGS